MTTDIIKFEGQHEVMILMKEDVNFDFKGDYLLRAKDGANALEYKQVKDFVALINPKYVHLVKNSDFAKSENRKLNNAGETFISSFGLYQALANSTMPKAEPFQDWLFEEMLPSIQKQGYYIMGSEQSLSPELQMFKSAFETAAKLELEQREQAKRITVVEQRQEHITDVLSLNPTEWRKKTKILLDRITQVRDDYEDYRAVRNESYQKLEERARCKLKTRLTNRKRRMALEGASKTRIDKVNNLDVIEEDAKLTEIYLAIVKEMAIRHGIELEEAT